MNILLIRTQSPEDPLNGCDLRVWNLFEQGNANVLCCNLKQNGENGKTINTKYRWKSIKLITSDSPLFSINHQDIFISNFFKRNHEIIEVIKNEILRFTTSNPNVIIVASGHEMGLVLSYCFPHKFIFEANADSKSLYFERRFKNLPNKKLIKKINSKYFSLVYRAIENYIASNSLLTIVPSEKDRQWILKGNSQASVLAIGNGTPLLQEPVMEKISKPKTNSVIAFHGAMTWPPNVTAALHLVRNIFPLISSQVSTVQLRIAGTPVFQELKKFENQPNIEICGFVENIRDWLAECDVYVMPMLQGSGVKNKLIEAMAAGLTIVTNSLGAEALSEEAKQSVVIADGEENIANAVVYLLNHPEESLELGKKARTMAEKYFRWETLSQQFMLEIEKVAQKINV